MHVAITGSSGLIGRALSARLRGDGHRVTGLVRRAPRSADERPWLPGVTDPTVLAGVEAVVHLAGKPLQPRPWTRSYRDEVLDSRVEGTATIARAAAAADPPPRVLLSASAVGYYGDTGGQPVDESAPAGAGFLAEVVRRWELATAPAAAAGIRVAQLRSGVVVDAHDRALAIQLPLFRAGLGARLGSGRQYLSWIALADEVAAIAHLLTADDVSGPVNLTAPEPVTNAEYTRELALAVHRPAWLSVPAVALRLALPGPAEDMLLVSQRVLPGRLAARGFAFRYPDVRSALRAAVAGTSAEGRGGG